jgi:hypothetical protein
MRTSNFTSEKVVERLNILCVRSPKKSIDRSSVQLGNMPKTAIHNVLCKRLRSHAHRIQLRHEIKDTDPPKRVEYADFMLNETDEDFSKARTYHKQSFVSH